MLREFDESGSFMLQRGLLPTRLTFIATGAYQDVVRRSFRANVTDETKTKYARTIWENGGRMDIIGLAGVANEIISPDTAIDQGIDITGGWSQPRLRFFLELRKPLGHGAELVYCYTGYTDGVGIDEDGNIDHYMTMHITGMTTIQRTESARGAGTLRVVKDDIVIVNQRYYRDETIDDRMDINSVRRRMNDRRSDEYIMDPHSVLAREHEHRSLQTHTLDGERSIPQYAKLSSSARRLNRSWNIPNHYLSRLTTIRQAAMQEDTLYDNSDYDYGFAQNSIDRRSLSMLRNDRFTDDPLVALYEEDTNISNTATLSFADLYEYFPSIDDPSIVTVIFPEAVREKSRGGSLGNLLDVLDEHGSETMEADDWRSANIETMIATMISQQLPNIMMSELIKRVIFTVTNQVTSNLADDYAWILGDDRRRTRDNRDAIWFMTELGSSAEMARVNAFKLKVERILLDAITKNNLIDIYLRIDCDVQGECSIWVQVQGGEEYKFVVPTFANAMSSSLITSSIDAFDDLSHDVMSLVDDVIEDL